MDERALALNRRRFLECFSAGSFALMPGALMAVAQDAPRITREMLEAAAKIAGLSFTPPGAGEHSRAGGVFPSARPIEIRSAYFTPAVDFIQANRFGTRVMQRMDEAMAGLDLFIGSNQLLTNRTGHPVVRMPSGFFRGSPTALHFTGKIFGDSEILLLAHAYQSATRHHQGRPPL